MQSLEIGKVIYAVLSTDSRLTTLVGNKIFPLIVDNGTTYPFIVYRRNNITANYTKDFHLSDEVLIDINCVSQSYEEGLKIAGIVRDILEDKRFTDKGIQSINLESADEDWIDEAYIQTLSFTIKINK